MWFIFESLDVNFHKKPDVVAYTCNLRTWETEAGGLLLVRGQPRVHSKF